jgi:hypothetical protein
MKPIFMQNLFDGKGLRKEGGIVREMEGILNSVCVLRWTRVRSDWSVGHI